MQTMRLSDPQFQATRTSWSHVAFQVGNWCTTSRFWVSPGINRAATSVLPGNARGSKHIGFTLLPMVTSSFPSHKNDQNYDYLSMTVCSNRMVSSNLYNPHSCGKRVLMSWIGLHNRPIMIKLSNLNGLEPKPLFSTVDYSWSKSQFTALGEKFKLVKKKKKSKFHYWMAFCFSWSSNNLKTIFFLALLHF